MSNNESPVVVKVYTNPDSGSLNRATRDQINETIDHFVSETYFNAEEGSTAGQREILWIWVNPGSKISANAVITVCADYSKFSGVGFWNIQRDDSRKLGEMLDKDLAGNPAITKELLILARCVHDVGPGFVAVTVAPTSPTL